MKNRRDIEQEVTDKIICQLEAGVAPWRRSWCSTGGAALRENGEPYRGYNQFLLSLAGRQNPFWLTYRKAAELGGQVRAGESATSVYFFKKLIVADKASGGDKTIPLIRFYAVFNAEQIDGLPMNYYPQHVERPAHERDQEADRFIASCRADIRHGSRDACYVPSGDFIRLPDRDAFMDYVSYAGTAVHELAHWTGHEKRLDRNLKNKFGGRDYAREELIAEASAALIMAQLGLEVEPREDHAAYISAWIEILKDDKTALRKAFSKAQSAVDFLNGLQAVELEDVA